MWTTMYVLAALLLAFIAYGFRLPAQWRARHLPGPMPTFFFGSMLQLQKKGSHVLHSEYTKKYGPIFKTYGPSGAANVVVTSPELVRSVLLHNHHRPPFPNMNASKEAKEFDAENILSARGDHWRSLRAAWSPVFFTGSLDGYAELMHASARTMVQRLAPAVQSGESVEIWRLLGDMTLDVVGGCAYGVDLNTQKPPDDISSEDTQRAQQLREDVAMFFKGFGGIRSRWFLLIVLFPELGSLWRKLGTWFPDKQLLPVRNARWRLVGLTRELINRHKAALAAQAELSSESGAGKEGLPKGSTVLEDGSALLPSNAAILPNGSSHTEKPTNGQKPASSKVAVHARPGIHADLRKGVAPGSFLDVLVRSVDRNGKPFSDTAIASQAFIMVLAGYETTANTLAFTMYNLARNPACQAKLAAEVDAHPGDPSYAELDNFPYADACLQESLRLFPPGAVGIRQAGKDQVLGGYHISKGTFLIASFWPMHRDEKVWRDPEAFIPERWIPGSPDAVSEETKKTAWAAFGGGPRQCPGYRFAVMEAKTALIHAFRAYTFRLAPGQIPLALRNTVTLSPRDGVHLTVHKRS